MITNNKRTLEICSRDEIMIEADMDVLVKFDCQANRQDDSIETEVR
jgi:hypothetical protein